MDAETYAAHCAKLVETYGEAIDRALRIDIERRDNQRIERRRTGKQHPDVSTTPDEAGDLRGARRWLDDAREAGADRELAVWFVVVHAEAVHPALIRQRSSERAALAQARRELRGAVGPARAYLRDCAAFTRRQVEALTEASAQIAELHETVVDRPSTQA